MTDGAALYTSGRYAEAARAFAERSARVPQDADAWVGLGQSLLADGRPAEAWEAAQKARGLVRAPAAIAIVEGLRARAAAALGRMDTAETAFRAALAARPGARTHAAFGVFLLNEGRLVEAEVELESATRLGGGADAEVLAARATVRTLSGKAGEAIEMLDTWTGAPVPALAMARARACGAAGRPAEAIGLVERALTTCAPTHRALLHHAQALLLDRMDDVPAAAAAFGAMHLARGVSVDPAAILALADDILIAYPVGARFPAPPPAVGPRPLFIVGLPRSGTSLCEQALAAHPVVHAAGERDELRRLALRFGEALGSPWPACAANVHRGAAQGAAMWRAAAGGGAASVVTDKMPDNLFRLGLAAQLLPDARAVIMQRDPMDTLLSCWQQAFGPAHAWTSTWEGLAAMAAASARVTARWLEEAPMPLCVVRYEDLVSAPETELREIAAFAGLPWDARVLAPEKVERVVRTASILQVREKMHTGSVGRWRRYAEVLAPLRERLGGYGL